MTKKEMTVLDAGGKPQRDILGKNPRDQAGTDNPIHTVPWRELNRGPRGGRRGKNHCANLQQGSPSPSRPACELFSVKKKLGATFGANVREKKRQTPAKSLGPAPDILVLRS